MIFWGGFRIRHSRLIVGWARGLNLCAGVTSNFLNVSEHALKDNTIPIGLSTYPHQPHPISTITRLQYSAFKNQDLLKYEIKDPKQMP